LPKYNLEHHPSGPSSFDPPRLKQALNEIAKIRAPQLAAMHGLGRFKPVRPCESGGDGCEGVECQFLVPTQFLEGRVLPIKSILDRQHRLKAIFPNTSKSSSRG